MESERKKELAVRVTYEQQQAALKSIWTLIQQHFETLDVVVADMEDWGGPLKVSSEQSSDTAAEIENIYERQKVAVGGKKEADEARNVFLDRLATLIMQMDLRFQALRSKQMSAAIAYMDPRSLRETFGPEGKLPRRKRIEILAQFADIIEEIHTP